MTCSKTSQKVWGTLSFTKKKSLRMSRFRVRKNGDVVTHDVPAHTMVAGVPAKIIKKVDEKTSSKTELEDNLRKL